MSKKFTRRDFIEMTALGLGSITFVSLGVWGTLKYEKNENKKIPKVPLTDLIKNPEQYKDKEIITQGYPEYLGEQSHYMPQWHFNNISNTLETSLSEETLTTYNFHISSDKNSEYIVMTDESGGLYFPSPVVPSLSTEYKDFMKVKGIVTKESDNKFLLQLTDILENEK